MSNLTEYISFCDRRADNVSQDEFKARILEDLKEKHQIEISHKPYTVLKPSRIPCVDRHPHTLSLRTIGNSYFLYLTTIDDIKYCFYIDRKIDAPKHMYPRILSVKYNFDAELYNDTLFDGELICDMEKRWYFILADILVYKGQLLKTQTIETKMELLYYVLQNNYKSDLLMDICPFQVKKLFTYQDIDYVISNYIPNLPYHVKGICFNTLNSQYSSYIYMFNQNERIPNLYQKSMSHQQEKNKIRHRNHLDHRNKPNRESSSKKFSFKIIQTNTSQIYDLYCLDKGKTVKYGVAYIGDIVHRQIITNFFKIANSKLDVIVDCYYIPRCRKWKPIVISNKKSPDNITKINEYINTLEESQ